MLQQHNNSSCAFHVWIWWCVGCLSCNTINRRFEMKTIKIPELKIEVEKELRPEVYKKDMKIPKGWRLLKGYEYLYLAENKIIPVYDEDRQWVTLGNNVASLNSGRYIDDDRLHVYGDDWVGDGGYAFGVRFCRSLK